MPLPPSAADWTRFKRLNAQNVIPYTFTYGAIRSENSFNPETLQSRTAGSLLARFPASYYTQYIDSTRSDFITKSETPACGTQVNRSQICPCTTSVLPPKLTGVRSAVYQHLRIL
jgi:hypothetical protein